MKKLAKRISSMFLAVVLAAALVPSDALASEASAGSGEATASSSASAAAAAAADAQAHSTTIVATTTVDEDGTVLESGTETTTSLEALADADNDIEFSDVEGSDNDSEADGDGDTDSDSDTGSGSDTGSDSSDAVTVVKTKKTYTYKLVITLTTTPVSSSNNIVKKLKVTKPKLTTTTKTTTTYSDGTTKTKTTKSTKTYSLSVKAYVRNAGWKKATLNSAGTAYTYTASKTASGKYLTAIQITPSAALKSAMKKAGVTFVYRAKAKYFGTLGWAKAGQKAGTTGNSAALTGLSLKVVSTSKVKTLSTANHYLTKPVVSYKTKSTGSSSWGSSKTNGSTSGTASSSASALGGLSLKLASSASYSGGIKYSTRTSQADSASAWSSWKSNGTASGSKNAKIKAIKVKLTGKMAKEYNVYYRVYVAGYGWLGWAKNGQKAGTKNVSYSISAVQVKLVPKGQSGPGSTAYHYVSSSTAKMAMILKAQSFSSSTRYLILVNRNTCRVGVFSGSRGNWTLKYYWQCTPGASSSPTVTGSFTMGSRGYSFGTSSYTCYYYTQITGNYLFHSVLYYAGTRTIKDGRLGMHLSHGCVRLAIQNAKWLYSNVPSGTKIYIY